MHHCFTGTDAELAAESGTPQAGPVHPSLQKHLSPSGQNPRPRASPQPPGHACQALLRGSGRTGAAVPVGVAALAAALAAAGCAAAAAAVATAGAAGSGGGFEARASSSPGLASCRPLLTPDGPAHGTE